MTIKQGQPVWPEWIDDDEAEDIGGKKYRLVEDHWVEQPEETDVQANSTPSDAA